MRHNLDRLQLGPSREDLGLNRLDLGAVGQEEGFLVRKGAVMVEIRLGKGIQPTIVLGKGIQPTMVLGKENFGLDLRDLQTLE